MANNLVQAESNRLLDASFGTTAYVAPTTPMKLAVLTANGSNTAAGTEAVGGSYARQTIAMSAASAGACSNSGTINFTAMPAGTFTGIEIFDSNGTPRRAWQGPLTVSKTLGAGDTLSFPPASITASDI